MPAQRTTVYALVLLVAAIPVYADGDLVPADALSAQGLYKYWQAALPLEPGERVTAYYLLAENIYCPTTKGAVFVVNADVGTIRWADILSSPNLPMFQPTLSRAKDQANAVVIATTRKIYFIDRLKGKRLREMKLRFSAGTGAISTDRFVYVGGVNGRMYCLRYASGENDYPITEWEVQTGGPISSMPQLVGNVIFFASEDRNVYAASAADKVKIWSHELGQPIFADLVADPSGVYVGCADRSLYCFDPAGGEQRWRLRTGAEIRRRPHLAGKTLYQYSENAGIAAVRPSDGKELWRFKKATRFISLDGKLVNLLTADGKIVRVNAATGKLVAALPTAGVNTIAPNEHDGTMFVGTDEGRLMCIQPKSVPYLRRQNLLAAEQEDADKQKGAAENDKSEKEGGDENADPLRSRSKVAPISGSQPETPPSSP